MTQPVWSRRTLLVGGSALWLSAGLGRPAIARDLVLADYPFTLGVASGDPSPDGFVIWTRLAPKPMEIGYGMPSAAAPVTYEVAADENFATVVSSGQTLARPELGHAVHVEIGGLQPGRPYWYRFAAAGARSMVGRSKTTPVPGDDPAAVRLAVVGCQSYEGGYYTAHRFVSQEDLDFVFCYGDYIYEGVGRLASDNPRAHLGQELYAIDDYRRRYAQYKLDPDLQAAHAAHPWFSVWDDHEVDNNWVSDIDQDDTPAELFALRKQMAFQAFYEAMPLRKSSLPRGTSLQLYRRARYGRLLDVHFLDTRQYRSNQVCGDKWLANCQDLDSAPDVLGSTQEKWLFDGLSRSQSRWRALAQQIMVMDLDRNVSEAFSVNLDTWAGYRTPRARLLKHIERRKIDNVVILTGDEHQHYVGEVHLDGRRPAKEPIAVEFVATSISSGGDGRDQREDIESFLRTNSPQLKFNSSRRGYLLCDITAERWRSDLKVVDKVSTPGGALSVSKSFVVEPGRARVMEA